MELGHSLSFDWYFTSEQDFKIKLRKYYYYDLDDQEPSKAFHNGGYAKTWLFGLHKNLFGSQIGSGHALREANDHFILAHLFLFFSMLFFYFCHALCLCEHEITLYCAKPSHAHGQHLCWTLDERQKNYLLLLES